MNQNNERMPYWFTHSQIDTLATIVGNSIDNGNASLSSVNDEIGISKARLNTSGIRSKISKLFNSKEENFVLMLSIEECINILSANVPDDIREVVSDGL